VVVGTGINPKQEMPFTWVMVVEWYGHILGLDMVIDMTKKCMMVHEQSLSKKLKKSNSTWMLEDFQSVDDVVSFCERRQMENHLAYPNARRQVSRFFPFG
jgi:hypothetical protein